MEDWRYLVGVDAVTALRIYEADGSELHVEPHSDGISLFASHHRTLMATLTLDEARCLARNLMHMVEQGEAQKERGGYCEY